MFCANYGSNLYEETSVLNKSDSEKRLYLKVALYTILLISVIAVALVGWKLWMQKSFYEFIPFGSSYEETYQRLKKSNRYGGEVIGSREKQSLLVTENYRGNEEISVATSYKFEREKLARVVIVLLNSKEDDGTKDGFHEMILKHIEFAFGKPDEETKGEVSLLTIKMYEWYKKNFKIELECLSTSTEQMMVSLQFKYAI